ncbi:MAG: CysB family HTH-type transcriptional regulator [Betaproteobacteria bacterium]|nr:CysB family HTH-type transcriptional regulator [Betaproteobacteria bacterium]
MNLQQLRYVRETVRRNLNLTDAARALHTSQPGVSKQIREFEEELGVDIFERHGRRFVALTPPGRELIGIIDRILLEVDNLRRVGENYAAGDSGRLTIATTHTQARYVLPRVIASFRERYPKVRLSLQQGNPSAVARWVLSGEADIGIATESLDHLEDLIALPAYTWTHSVVVRPDHALANSGALTLQAIAEYPIITYSKEFTGRSHIDEAFAAQGLAPDIVLTAIDSDVIKTYVELGLGIGIIASVAFDPERDRQLKCFEAEQLFPINTTRVAIRRGAYLRDFTIAFIESFAPDLTRERVIEAIGSNRTADAE